MGDFMRKFVKKSVAFLIFCAIILNMSACTTTETPSEKTDLVSATVIEIEKINIFVEGVRVID